MHGNTELYRYIFNCKAKSKRWTGDNDNFLLNISAFLLSSFSRVIDYDKLVKGHGSAQLGTEKHIIASRSTIASKLDNQTSVLEFPSN